MKPFNVFLNSVLFFVVDVVSSSSLHSQLVNPSEKVWINTCRIFYCEFGLNMCVRNGCLGRSNCQNCIKEFFASCEICAQDIFSEAQDFLNTGTATLLCDPSDQLHQVACSFFCRSNLKLYSECKLMSQKPLCQCLDDEPSSFQSTTGSVFSSTASLTSTAYMASTNGNTFQSATPTIAASSTTSRVTTRPLATTSWYKPLIDNPYVKATINAHPGRSISSLLVLKSDEIASNSYRGINEKRYEEMSVWNLFDGLQESYTLNYVVDNKELVSIVSASLPNGDFVTASYKNITIWSSQIAVRKVIKAHDDFVRALVVLENGDLASGSDDGKIKIWDTNNGANRMAWSCMNQVDSLAVLSNHDLAVGLYNGKIQIWNTVTGVMKFSINAHLIHVTTLVKMPNGNLASTSVDRQIKIWSLANGSLLRTMQGHSNTIYSLILLPNGDLASGSGDSTIKIWNSETGVLRKTLSQPSGSWYCLAVMNNGDLVAGTYENIKIWRIF